MRNLSHQIPTTYVESNIIPYFIKEETGLGRLCKQLSLLDRNPCIFFTTEPKPGDCLECNSKFRMAMAFLTYF